MLQTPKSESIVGEVPTNEEIFYAEYGDDLTRDTIPFLNQVLRQFVTLSTALMGGSIAFLSDSLVDPDFKKSIVVLFLFSLVAALLGVLPYRGKFHRRCPNEIKEVCLSARTWKTRFLWISAAMIFIGSLVAILGILCK